MQYIKYNLQYATFISKSCFFCLILHLQILLITFAFFIRNKIFAT